MIVPDTILQADLTSAGRAKYKALAQAIQQSIESDELAAGAKVPPVRDLAYQLGVTPGTVARAYSVLTETGQLTAGVGRGTFVRGVKSEPAAPITWKPTTLLPASVEDPAQAHLLSPKLPDVGQVALLREEMANLATALAPEELLRYPSRETDIAARLCFAARLDADHVGPFSPDDIVVANGGQNAIMMILQTILKGPDPVIAVDELSYGGFRSAALMNRAEVVAVPWDAEGPEPAVLEHHIKTRGVQVFCTSAEVCNPTVATTSIARREEIARLAVKHGVHILDDDCYRLVRTQYKGPSYRALCPTLGWYVTSPSKSITPSLRIGFALAPKGAEKALVRTATYNAFGVTRIITDLYVAIMQRPEMDGILDAVQRHIAKDIQAAVNSLGRYALRWSEDVPFFWLDLPTGWRAGEFCKAAEMEGVLIKSAEEFGLRESRMIHGVRVALNGQVSHTFFLEALRKLRDLLDNPPERISV